MRTMLILSSLCILFAGRTQEQAPLEATVLNAKGAPYVGDQVQFVGQKSKKVFTGITNQLGKFKLSLPGGDVYEIKIKGLGDEIEYSTFEIEALKPGYHYDQQLIEIRYEMPKSVNLKNLNFESGSSTLKKESMQLLNDLADVLNHRLDLKLSIEGHTDDEGNELANQKLSEERALVVKRYLESKGIASKRLQHKGYGESQPIADNASPEGRAMNRRTMLIVL